MSITRGIRRVCNYVTWNWPIKKAVHRVGYHKRLTSSQRKQWMRLPARKRLQLVKKHAQRRGHYINEVRDYD